MIQNITVIKRDGRREPLDIDKIQIVTEDACEGLSGVSQSMLEMNANIEFYDGITTSEIQNILIRSAENLISLDTPNYQYVAARLLLFSIYKEAFGRFEPLHLTEVVSRNTDAGLYDSRIMSKYSSEDFEKMNKWLKHNRDYNFTYAGLRQVYDKYLLQDRVDRKVYESPQIAYMLIAATLFADYPQETRLKWVKRYYDATSQWKINLPTPIIGGLRTRQRQYASCFLISVDDTMNSILSSNSAIGSYVAGGAGVGIEIGRIRALGDKVDGGRVEHTGLLPFLKMFEATTRSCMQGGLRGGNSTVYLPFWHKQIEQFIVWKNNKGSEDSRARKMDYSVVLSKLFYERYLKDDTISLFSPKDVPGLYDAFGDNETFDALYVKYEKDATVPRETVKARDIFHDIIRERQETGRVYIMNIDHANDHSSFLGPIVKMSNLCLEVLLPTKPIQHIDDPNGEIATCILSAVNWSAVKLDEMEDVCELIVRGLNALIDFQEYPVVAAEKFTLNRRALGVGIIGLAHFLAKNKVKYGEPEGLRLVHEMMEAQSYYLTKASMEMAKEFGPCPKFEETKYSKGIMPIDTYKRDIDEFANFEYRLDWKWLKNQIIGHGMLNSTLSCVMPSESSSLVCNTTNGIEPPRSFLSQKVSKRGVLKQIVPQYQSLKNHYDLLWDDHSVTEGYLKTAAVITKFLDQSASTNTSYNPIWFENDEIPLSVLVKDLLMAYKWGLKTLYYANSYDMKDDSIKEEPDQGNIPEQDDPLKEPEVCEACTI